MCGTVPPCPCLHGRWETYIWFHPALNKYVYPGCSHFDNGATSKIDDVLFEHGRLLYILPLTDHPTYLWYTSRGDHAKMFLVFEFVCGTPPSCLKVRGWVVVVGGLQQFSVRPKPLGFGVLGLSVWGQGLTIMIPYHGL